MFNENLRRMTLAALTGGASGLSRELATNLLTTWAPKKATTAPSSQAPARPAAAAGGTRAPRGGVDIFVGGALDPIVGRNTLDYRDAYAASTGRPSKYFTHLNVPGVRQAIRDGNASGGPVNVIGHSYGGTAAYNAAVLAAGDGARIDNLVTIDPVGRLANRDHGFSDPEVRNWTNVTAAPARRDVSDWIAELGGKKPAIPVDYADRNVTSAANHADFARMMNESGARTDLERARDRR